MNNREAIAKSEFSFELPFHDMCSRHIGICYSQRRVAAPVNFNDVGLSQVPQVISYDGSRFVYKGVSDGRAIYQEESAC